MLGFDGIEKQHELLPLVLQVGKEKGSVLIHDDQARRGISFEQDLVHIFVEDFGQFMLSSTSHPTRVAGFYLLVSTNQVSRPLLVGALRCLRTFLPYMHADTDVAFRRDVLSLLQTLFVRIRAASSSLGRMLRKEQILGETTGPEHLRLSPSILDAHRQFMEWFHAFIALEMHPSASYQRHISALSSLRLLVKSGVDEKLPLMVLSKSAEMGIKWPFDIEIFDRKTLRGLFDLLLDAFNDVQEDAQSLMEIGQAGAAYSNLNHRKIWRSELSHALESARSKMLHSGRMDHADGFARLYSLLAQSILVENNAPTDLDGEDSLQSHRLISGVIDGILGSIEAAILVAKGGLAAAVNEHPIHGLFISLRYVLRGPLESSSESHANQNIREATMPQLARLARSVLETWGVVTPLLCNDAPEGFMPGDIEEEGEISTKDVLSYAWRALKESMLLAKEIGLRFAEYPLKLNPDDNAQTTVIEQFGNLCFTQLAEIRHRVKRALSIIDEKGSMVTRRSAGIPALLVALICADSAGSLVDKAVGDLLNIAGRKPGSSETDETSLPQVHAMNSLKVLFSSSKMGSSLNKHIVKVMEMSAEGMGSPRWAIRNCSLMLFRSLIDRLVGSNESYTETFEPSKNVARLNYERFSGLSELILRMLGDSSKAATSDGEAIRTEAIFPVLGLLRRAPPSGSIRSVMMPLILDAVGHPEWHVREIASRTYAVLSDKANVVEEWAALMTKYATLSHNAVHGRVLCLKYLILGRQGNGLVENVHGFVRLLNEIAMISSDVLSGRFSPIVKATYLELANLIGEICAFAEDAHSKGALPMFADLCKADDIRKSTADTAEITNPIFSLLSRASMKLHLLETLWEMRYSNDPASDIEDVTVSKNAQHVFLRPASPDTTWSTKLSVIEAMDELVSSAPLHVATLYGRLLSDSLTPTASLGQPHAFLEPSIVRIIDRCTLRQPRSAIHLQKRLAAASSDSPSLSSTLWTATTPENLATALRAWAHKIAGRRLLHGTWSDSLLSELQHWDAAMRCAIHEDNDFSLRLSAAQSLQALTHIWSLHPRIPSRVLVDLIFTLHDIMTDDDDDIRDVGASVAHTLLSFLSTKHPGPPDTSRTPIPPIARSSLRQFLVKSPHTRDAHPFIAREALRRLANASSQPGEAVEFRDVNKQLEELDRLNEHTPLFATEKQNLYFDPVRDQCDAWSVVLKRLFLQSATRKSAATLQSPPPPLTSQTLQALTTHTHNSIIALTQRAESADPLASGALGWSSAPDYFVLGMRVVHCADVVLNAVGCFGSSLGCAGAGAGYRGRGDDKVLKKSKTKIRRALVQFLKVGRERDVHPLWLEGAERVLVCAVRRGLGRVGGVVSSIEEGLAGHRDESDF
ncbi:MAG: hypothetical protein M1831_005084 [Alyxoria varia]|nr:MAG: hypothetical protein M1831_005084 [Alyxoria varia]